MRIKSLAHYAKGTLKFLIYTSQLLLNTCVSAICRSISPSVRSAFQLSFTVLVHYLSQKEYLDLGSGPPIFNQNFAGSGLLNTNPKDPKI
jgi:hypothetical protein